jgi:SAM-dependent methyltransferase
MHHLSTSLLLRVVLWAVSTLLIGSAATQQSKPRPSTSPAPAAKSTPTPDDRIDRPTSEPYTGSLSIFEDPKRDEKLQVNRVMDILAIREGSVVADIGAGSGWFTVRAAQRVGSPGIVYAVEINQEYVNHIRSRAESENLPNIRTILGKEDDPTLPPSSVDSILLLKTYHEFSKPINMLRAMHKAMRRDALLGIIDRNGAGDDHGVKRELVIKEAATAGFALVEEHDFVKPDGMDYFLVFRKVDTVKGSED